jgi:hypothetical protein
VPKPVVYGTCHVCHRDVQVRVGHLSSHKNRMKKGEPTCEGSGKPVRVRK